MSEFFNSPFPYLTCVCICMVMYFMPWKNESGGRFFRFITVLAALANAFVAGLATP